MTGTPTSEPVSTTPTPTPTAASPAVTAADFAGDGNVVSDDDDSGILDTFLPPGGEPEPSSPAAQPTTSAAAVAQPTATSAAAVVTPAPTTSAGVVTQPATTSAAAVVTEPSVSAAPAIDPVESFKSWRSNAEGLLAEHHYALSDEEADGILSDPKKFVPKLAARLYLDAVTAATNVIARNIPQILDRHLKLRDDLSAAEDRFFGQWPGLKDKKGDVYRFGAQYRQMNPSATEDQFIRDVGAQVLVALGMSPEVARGQQQAPVTTPPVVQPTARPFQPVGAATPRAVPVAGASVGNPFTDLAAD